MNMRKMISVLCILTLLSTCMGLGYADNTGAPYEKTVSTIEVKPIADMKLNVDKAVTYGLEHNTNIQTLEKEIEMAILSKETAEESVKKFEDNYKALATGQAKLATEKGKLESGIKYANKAQTAIDKGMIPDAETMFFLKASVDESLIAAPSNPELLAAKGLLAMLTSNVAIPSPAVKVGLQSLLNDIRKNIDLGLIAFSEGNTLLKSSQDAMKYTLQTTSQKLGAKINYNGLITLSDDDATELMISMAGVNLDVTKYAKGIYRNQIAMLIQKNYYDALQAEKILELRSKAMDRGEKQFSFVTLSYENGMKARDDMLLSKMYYDGTVIAYELAKAQYENAVLELKKNMNIDLEIKLTLEDNMIENVEFGTLEYGLKSGMKNRLEVQKNLGQLMIYKLNEEILGTLYMYRDENKITGEARLLREASEIDLEKNLKFIETEISQSYVLMTATGEMLRSSKELIHDAQEVVQIADLKYQQGFGAENSLLKQMNLESSSGTIIELIAAEENLVKVQAQVAQIRYSYTMAKVKYLNDAGILTY